MSNVLHLIAALYASKLAVSGLLFVLGPIIFDIDYAVTSTAILVIAYLIVLIKLVAESWIVLTLINTDIIKHWSTKLIIILTIICSGCHLFIVYSQNIPSHDTYVLDVMKNNSIEVIFLMILYAYVVSSNAEFNS